MENLHKAQRKEQENRIKELEKIFNCRDSRFKCKQCDYTTGSEQGLKTHISKKHKQMEGSLDFPTSCNLCEKELDCLKDYKLHMKTHSYRLIQYQCNMCNFSEYNEIGIEVHVGREHGENFECGLCEYIAEDLEVLDVHLQSCEIYKCSNCGSVLKNLQELKQHFLDLHGNDKKRKATHMKQSREDRYSYDTREYCFEDLCQM